MKAILSIFLSSISFGVLAQESLYVNTPTVAYSDDKATIEKGIYTAGAQINSFEKINKNIYKVFIDYADPVYILNSPNIGYKSEINTHATSPAPIIDVDEYYSTPHLFVTVAGLKVREYPSSTSSILGTVFNGTVVPISFYPSDKNEWVAIPYKGEIGYISANYIGARPIMKELINQYYSSKEPKEQKKYAERILELGWNSETKETIKALTLFSEYTSTNNLEELAVLTKLQKEVLEANSKKSIANKIAKLQKKELFGFTLNGEVEPINGFNHTVVEKYVGYPLETYADLEDCALGDYESNAFYNSAEFIIHDLKLTLKTRKMDMINANGFLLDNNQLNGNTSEKEFLTIGKGFITNINALDKSYSIEIGTITYVFLFYNGFLTKVEMNYSC
ncbi:SH3 domain-containing protein [Myroides injenensis]|uniref:SH3 domain-containing protein n=1 Tax=Myroides injenensis TaxID=1183151 RepID=UPI000289E0F3|nr:SH3 domain-containing protein [Myroides injenensis]